MLLEHWSLLYKQITVFFSYMLKSEFKKTEPKVAIMYFPLPSVIITAQ